MQNCRVLITGGAGLIGSHIADLLAEQDVREIVVFDNFVRGRRENLARAEASSRLTVVEGDIRDRKLLAEVMQGIDLVFHQAAIRITQCAEDPRLALEVLVDGTFNLAEQASAPALQCLAQRPFRAAARCFHRQSVEYARDLLFTKTGQKAQMGAEGR
jgi:UDP-glucose 4-epimerase